MKQTTAALAILLSLASTAAMAVQDNSYQHEAGLNYNGNSEEFGDGTWNANYRYYFKSVDQAKGPYALNGFLAQESNLGASYSNYDALDTDTFGIDGTYVFDSNWFVSANYSRVDVGSHDANTYGAEVGYYFNNASSVSAFFNDGDNNIEESYGLKLRSFIALKSTSGVDLSASWTHADSDDAFNVKADWYINKAWSVGLGYSDNGDDDNFSVSTAYWWRLSDSFSANFGLAKVLDSDVDGVDIGLGLIGRF
ncbi:putative porin [Shewanella salipaludis]|uniref:Porin n=1 Tax=Shewanella salipaludis TaxID=2723052 RepID=A0A972G0T5_9GAMM|nr:putative porin [Shewanella salipaludis]NMH65431.1 putative porin [Shewanella salipaludis]